MSASTLYTGVPQSAPTDGDPTTLFRNLGEAFAVKGDVSGRPERKEGRSFEDALRVVDEMTSGRPKRCPDNLQLTAWLVDRLGLKDTLHRMKFVHIAGTKGKGTTAAYTAALLQTYGYKVGLFTSPHLVDLRERVMVDNSFFSKDTFARYFFEFRDRYEALRYSGSQLDRETASRSNFFRFIFLFSLYVFGEESVQVAVMEVGLGGRIDATNVVPASVSVITALGFDHMEILGDTLEAIAEEKAGIMKADTICFASPQHDHPSTRRVLEKHARATNTPLLLLDNDVLPIRSWPRLAIGGEHAIEDSKLALMAARRIGGIPPTLPLDEVEREVLSTMTFAGRSQIVPVGDGSDMTLYMDGAHTPESLVRAVRWFVQASAAASPGDPNPRRVILFYTSRDRQLVLKPFMPYTSLFSKVIVAQLDSPKMTDTSASKDDVEARLRGAREDMVATTECWRSLYREVPCLPYARPFESVEDILDLIIPAASEVEDASKPAHVLVCGSFYLVGDILSLLRDYRGTGKYQGNDRV